MSGFGSTIKRIREEKGMSQGEFAEFLGVFKQNISRWELGDRSPKITTAAAIAEKLGITLQELNGGEAPEPDSDDEIMAMRERMRRQPEQRVLFDLTKDATTEDLETINRMIKAYLNK